MQRPHTLKLAYWLNSLFKFTNHSMLFYWGVYFTQIELNGWQQGMIFGLYPLISLVSVIPLGLLNDRLHSRSLIILGFLFISTQFFGAAYVTDFIPLLGIFLVGSLGAIICKLSFDSFFYKHSNRDNKSEVGQYVGIYLLGAGAGALTGGSILDVIPFIQWFHVIGGMTLSMALISTFLPKEETFHFELRTYRKDLVKPHVLIFMLTIFLWAIHMGAEVTSYGLFLREDLGLNYQQMGLFMGSAILMMFLWAQLASRKLKAGTPPLKILYTGLILSGLGLGLMVLLKDELLLSYLSRVIHEAGDAFMFIFLYDGVRSLFAKERAGGHTGAINFTQQCGFLLGSLAFATIGDIYSSGHALLIAGILPFVALILAYRFSHQINH